jgi:tRNA(Phe) wybutosine-synthesizing methylase Tyw3
VVVVVGTTHLTVPAVDQVVVVVEILRYKRPLHPIKEMLEVRVKLAALAMVVVVAAVAPGPRV